MWLLYFFFQAEDGIRDAQESRGLGDVYKRQVEELSKAFEVKEKLKLPLVIRPSFTLGGTGGGVAVSYTHLTLPTNREV